MPSFSTLPAMDKGAVFSTCLQAPLWYCATRRHTQRSCGYDVCTVALKSKAFNVLVYFLTFLSRPTIERGSRALFSLGPPFVIFAREQRREAAMYDVT